MGFCKLVQETVYICGNISSKMYYYHYLILCCYHSSIISNEACGKLLADTESYGTSYLKAPPEVLHKDYFSKYLN